MSGSGLLGRLERKPLRQQFVASFGTLIVVLLLISAACAGAVIWASVTLRDASERIVALQTANRDVLQDMTNAETGLRGYGLTADRSSLVPYELAMAWLPQDQQRLRGLALDDRELLSVTEEQDQVIASWLNGYADPLLAPGHSTTGSHQQLFKRGDVMFSRLRRVNDRVNARISAVVDGIHHRSRTVIFIALLVVVLLPLGALGVLLLIMRRTGDAVVKPLVDIAAVLERLRAGDTTARAEIAGPEEIRQIAADLNSLTDENVRASEVEADVLNQLESIDRVRTDLISTVSHELRTPLTSIKGYLELIQDELIDGLTPTQAKMMSTIRRNLDRLNELITNLLALSRAEETQLSIEPLDVRGVAAEVAGDLRLTAAARDISVRTLQSVAPVVILGDRSQLVRAVTNLVANAVKFSRPGGTVEIRVMQDGSSAVLEVVDEGIGIPQADLAGLGSRFYRASNAMRAEIAGTGLGLRIVQTILDRHDGELAVESVEGEGSTFTIRLPISHTPYDRAVERPLVAPSYD